MAAFRAGHCAERECCGSIRVGRNRITVKPNGLFTVVRFHKVPISTCCLAYHKAMAACDRSTLMSCDPSDYVLCDWRRVPKTSNYSLLYKT